MLSNKTIHIVLIILAAILIVFALLFIFKKPDKIESLIANHEEYEELLDEAFESYEIIKTGQNEKSLIIDTKINGEKTSYYFRDDEGYTLYYYGVTKLKAQCDFLVNLKEQTLMISLKYPTGITWCRYNLNDLSVIPDKISYTSSNHVEADGIIKKYVDYDTILDIVETGNDIRQTLLDMVDDYS